MVKHDCQNGLCGSPATHETLRPVIGEKLYKCTNIAKGFCVKDLTGSINIASIYGL